MKQPLDQTDAPDKALLRSLVVKLKLLQDVITRHSSTRMHRVIYTLPWCWICFNREVVCNVEKQRWEVVDIWHFPEFRVSEDTQYCNTVSAWVSFTIEHPHGGALHHSLLHKLHSPWCLHVFLFCFVFCLFVFSFVFVFFSKSGIAEILWSTWYSESIRMFQPIDSFWQLFVREIRTRDMHIKMIGQNKFFHVLCIGENWQREPLWEETVMCRESRSGFRRSFGASSTKSPYSRR